MSGVIIFNGTLEDKITLIQKLFERCKTIAPAYVGKKVTSISREEAAQLIDEHIDYLHGRCMKIIIKSDSNEIYKWGYERDNGPIIQEIVDSILN
jgi:hypothetical protein